MLCGTVQYVSFRCVTNALIPLAVVYTMLIDIVDAKYKEAFLHWLPSMLVRAYKKKQSEAKRYTQQEWNKAWVDKLSTYSVGQRKAWYDKRLGIMLEDEKKEEEKQEK